MAERPGILLYFSDWNTAARRLTVEQRGELITALMAFGATGEVPDINDQITAFAFDIFSEKIRRDFENYNRACLKNAHNTYIRECKKNNVTPLSFDEWVARYRAVSIDIQPETELETETKQETELETETGLGNGERTGKGTGEGTRGRERENPRAEDYTREDWAAAMRYIELEKKRSGRA